MESAADADPRGKRDPRDFALWKGHKQGEPESASWVTPWGRGRPGWHLECSAMAWKYLGTEFDIHGGGIDLRFPHHENEMAQSKAAGQQFSRFWMHNAWITTSGEKMSKSMGNSMLVSEVVKRVRPIELRYYLVSSHYRSHVEFSFESLEEAATAFRRIEGYVLRSAEVVRSTGQELTAAPAAMCAKFAAAMDDDLAVPAALAALQDVIREGNKLLAGGVSPALEGNLASVRAMLAVLGLDPLGKPWAADGAATDLREVVDNLVALALAERAAARERKDFEAADRLRGRLEAAGVEVEDTTTGPRWTLRKDRAPDAR
jgi:cysteinyl-tRNA synthetase